MSSKLVARDGIIDESLRRNYGRIRIGILDLYLHSWEFSMPDMAVEIRVHYRHLDFEANFHVGVGAPSLQEVAQKLQAILDPLVKQEPSITCPKCGMTSYHPGDIQHKYCGNCHMYHSEMAL